MFRVLPLLFVLFISGQDTADFKEKNEYVTILREEFNQHNLSVPESKSEKLFRLKENHPDINIRAINYLGWIYNKSNDHDYKKIKLLETFKNRDDFDFTHDLVQFYTHHLLAHYYSKYLLFEKAFDSNVLANKVIEKDAQLYPIEKAKSQQPIKNITSKVFRDEEESIENYKKYLAEESIEKDLNEQQRANFNIAVLSINLGKYRQGIEYAQNTLEYIKKSPENKMFIGSYIVLSNAYYQLGKMDSVRFVNQQIEDFYESKKIDSKALYIFYLHQLEDLEAIGDEEFIQNRIDFLHSKWDENCKNRYNLTILYKAKAHYARVKNDIQEERKILLKELEILNMCGELGQFATNEKHNVYKRLIDIDLKTGRSEDIPKWYQGKKEIEKKYHENSNLHIQLTQYFSESDLLYAQKDIEFQKQKVEDTKRLNLFYGIAVIVLILAIIYVTILYLKNRKIQKNLRLNNEKLVQQMKTINRQNDKMKELVMALEESNENLQNFARIAAHDIKSPISSFHSTISYFSEKYKEKINQSDQKLFNTLDQSTIRLSNMINVLLEYSTHHKNMDRNQEVNINEVLKGIQSQLQKQIKHRKVELSLPSKIPTIRSNKVLIDQLFFNLINNAIKFSKPNIIPEISIKFKKVNEDTIEFQIRDNGIGIPNEHQNEIFKVFQKFHEGKKQMGSGIGLAICKKIVQDFKGEIWVESEVGEGTCFYFTLPLYVSDPVLKSAFAEY